MHEDWEICFGWDLDFVWLDEAFGGFLFTWVGLKK